MQTGKITLLLLAALLLSCQKDRMEADVSGIETDLVIKHLEKDIYPPDGRFDRAFVDSLQKAYRPFFDLYAQQIIQVGEPGWKAFPGHLEHFVTDFRLQGAARRAREIFGDFAPYGKQLENAFRHYRYYFPQDTLPVIYTMLTGFNQSIITDTHTLGIGLDKYLGKDYEMYGRLGWPLYKRKRMEPRYMVRDALYAYAKMLYPFRPGKDNLLSRMLYQGKLLYFTHAMMPGIDRHDLMKYPEKKYQWCLDNETHLWAYFIEKKILFSSKPMIYRKMLQDAPFTAQFGKESPGQVARWMGYRIVYQYMDKHPGTSLAALMHNHDYQHILNQSGYDP